MPCWPIDQAVAYMGEQSGRHFDPQLLALLLQ
jgi:response regulator RpfG family c-di-GMP phosphodiesterase